MKLRMIDLLLGAMTGEATNRMTVAEQAVAEAEEMTLEEQDPIPLATEEEVVEEAHASSVDRRATLQESVLILIKEALSLVAAGKDLVEVATKDALSAIKKATWQETVRTPHQRMLAEAAVVEVEVAAQ